MPTSKLPPARSAAPTAKAAAKTRSAVVKAEAPDASNRSVRTATSDETTVRTEESASPSALIDARIEALGDWRGELLSRLRAVIREADPAVTEEWKWSTPVWSHHGILCTGETYKKAVKMTFAKGAALADPSGLFNASLEGNVRRAIDFHQDDRLDEEALKALIRAAVAFNRSPS